MSPILLFSLIGIAIIILGLFCYFYFIDTDSTLSHIFKSDRNKLNSNSLNAGELDGGGIEEPVELAPGEIVLDEKITKDSEGVISSNSNRYRVVKQDGPEALYNIEMNNLADGTVEICLSSFKNATSTEKYVEDADGEFKGEDKNYSLVSEEYIVPTELSLKTAESSDKIEAADTLKVDSVVYEETKTDIYAEKKEQEFADGDIIRFCYIANPVKDKYLKFGEHSIELILITDAEHLDEKRDFVENVYELVKERDDNWTSEIPAEHYIRVTFERDLNSGKDITIYARSSYSGATVEVYENNGTEKIADFGEITADGKYKVYLTGLIGEQDTFDLKVVGNPVEFDYIVDPDEPMTTCTAVGGTVTTYVNASGTNFTVHTFLSNSSFNITSDSNNCTVEYLVVAGGGGGGGGLGGGGGAGGFRNGTIYINGSTNTTVTVGAGGIGGVWANAMSTSGGNSTFSSITSIGGGFGGGGYQTPETQYNHGGDGGSGGGGGCFGQTDNVQGNGTIGQGNNGADCYDKYGPIYAAGGGGGAGGIPTGTYKQTGGIGLASSINGSSVTYAGGGGGASYGTTTSVGAGGSGIGGGANNTARGYDAMANRGSGGGGGGQNSGGSRQDGGNGSSGIVIIRYLTISGADTVYPTFSTFQTGPANNSAYAPNQLYQFNTTIANTNGTTGIEFNSVNYSMFNSTDAIFNKTFSNLAAGTYPYYFWAFGNGTSNNYNTTTTFYYTIAKATSAINLTLNGTQADISISEGMSINLNCSTITGDASATLTLYKNGTLINSGTSPIGNLTTFSSMGLYNITCYYSSSQNYSTSSQTYWVNTSDTTAPVVNITYPLNTTYTINVSALNYTYSDANPGSCWYSRDSGLTNSTAVSAGTNFTSVTSVEGSNTWRVYCNDTSGNVNSSSVTFVKDEVDECGTLTSSLTLRNSVSGDCFVIAANNIVLDCAGYSITYNGYGVVINNNINNTTIKNCNITKTSTGGSEVFGIYADAAIFTSNSNITIYNNTITTNGGYATDAIHLTIGNGRNVNITSNTISVNSTAINANNDGIYLNGDSISYINYNIISTDGAGYANDGIKSYLSNNTVIGNTITVRKAGSAGIQLRDTANNIVNYNSIKGENYASYGLLLWTSNNDKVNFNNISSVTAYGIVLPSNNNSVFTNNIISMPQGKALAIYLDSCNNQFINHTINMTSDEFWHTQDTSRNNTATNIQLIKTGINITYLLSTNGSEIEELSISEAAGYGNATNKKPLNKFFSITNTSTTASLDINVSYTDDEVTTLNILESDLRLYRYSGAWEKTSFTTGVDTTNNIVYSTGIKNFSPFGIFGAGPEVPAITIVTPVNGIVYNNKTQLINISTNLADNVWWYNGTANITYTTPVYFDFAEGSNTLYAYANNSAGDNFTTSTFTIDTIPPTIEIYSPDTIVYTNASVLVNISAAGANTIWWYVANDTPSGNNLTSNQTYTTPIYFDMPQGTPLYLIVYANDSAGNLNSTNRQFSVDSIVPTIEIYSPLNISYNTQNILINLSCYDKESCYLEWSKDGGITNISYSTPTTETFSEGSNTLSVFAIDFFNNRNSSSVTFFVDSIAPNITVIAPSNNTISNVSSQNFTANFSDENGIENITLNIYNETGLYNQTTISLGGVLQYSAGIVVWLVDGIYNWFWQAIDLIGNVADSQTTEGNRTITIDTIPAGIAIVYPENISYTVDINHLDYIVNDIHLSNCWYSTDGGSTTIPIVCGVNASGLTSNEGSNTWIVYANDTAGNINSSSVTFFKDTITPIITIYSPENITYNDTTFVLVNFTADSYQALWFNNGTANITYTSPDNYNTSDGSNTWIFYANDSIGNLNTTYLTFVTDYCTPNMTYTAWTDWINTTCSASQMNQSRSRVNYDSKDCGEIANTTEYQYQLVGPNYLNTTTSDWINTTCSGSQMNQSRFFIEYDTYDCAANITHYEYQLVGPTYQNTSFGSWNNISCIFGDVMNQSRNATQYDVYSCAVNTTVFEYRATEYCEFPRPTIAFISPTPNSGTVQTLDDSITAKVQGTTPYLKNMTIFFYDNGLNLVNSYTGYSSPFEAIESGLTNGIYYINATIYDTYGQINATETRNITINLGAINGTAAIEILYNNENIGTYKFGNDINLPQGCLVGGVGYCTNCQITSITYPDSTSISGGVMSKNNDKYNYTLISNYTKSSGTYTVSGICTRSSLKEIWKYSFDVTPSGDKTSTTFFIILAIASVIILLLGFIFKNYIFSFIAGLLFSATGVYTMIYGFADTASDFTRIISMVVLGLGLIITVVSAMEFLEEMSGGDTEFTGESDDE